MTVSIKVSALRSALNTALESLGAKAARGSMSYDKETGKVTLTVDSGNANVATTQSETGDVVKDKFLNTVAKLELDKKVRRWYNRNLIDVNGDKWLITAISNKGDKFTLSPKDGEGRNKRVDFVDVENVIAAGRTGRIDLGTKPRGTVTTTESKPTGKVSDVDAVKTYLDSLDAKQVTEVYTLCLDKSLVEAVTRRNNKARVEAILASPKLKGRGSVMTILKKFGSEPKAKPKATKPEGALTMKQRHKLELTLKPNYAADRKRFAKAVNSKFSRVAFLTEYTVKESVRVIVGYLVEEEKVRVYDPVNGNFRKVDAAVVLRHISK